MAARSLNKVMLIGNLTRDPNLRFTPNGTAVCSFGLATNRTILASDGSKDERVDFHNIVAWGKLAEICGQLLHKGDKTYVEGRLQTRDWKTAEGAERRITEVVIDQMMLLYSPGGRAQSESYSDDYAPEYGTAEPATQAAAPAPKGRGRKAEAAETDIDAPGDDVVDVQDIADDIPF